MDSPRTYTEWEQRVPKCITDDALWTMKAYRLALFASDLAKEDCAKLIASPTSRSLADQLNRAIGSIGANLAEGYSRYGRRDRAHFFEYALGSAREARHWYYQHRSVLGERVTAHRLDLLTQITKLLVVSVNASRNDRRRDVQDDPSEAGSR